MAAVVATVWIAGARINATKQARREQQLAFVNTLELAAQKLCDEVNNLRNSIWQYSRAGTAETALIEFSRARVDLTAAVAIFAQIDLLPSFLPLPSLATSFERVRRCAQAIADAAAENSQSIQAAIRARSNGLQFIETALSEFEAARSRLSKEEMKFFEWLEES